MEHGHALGSRDLLPERHDNLLERQLPIRGRRPRGHRELGTAFRLGTSEAPTADAVRLQAAPARTTGLAAVIGPAKVYEQAVGIILGERPDLFGIEIAAIRAQKWMLSEALLRVRPGASVVFRTSGLLQRRGRRSSASGWGFACGACSGFRSIRETWADESVEGRQKVSALFVSI
jgi:hypothetical protein